MLVKGVGAARDDATGLYLPVSHAGSKWSLKVASLFSGHARESELTLSM